MPLPELRGERYSVPRVRRLIFHMRPSILALGQPLNIKQIRISPNDNLEVGKSGCSVVTTGIVGAY
jgi:hypothetical protein